MSPEELALLGFPRTQNPLRRPPELSGFTDFTFSYLAVPQSSPLRLLLSNGGHSSFYIGNFNVYLAKELSRTLRMLGEVRFTYLPNGTLAQDPLGRTRVSTSVQDYNQLGRDLRWGGVVIERIYIDWDIFPLLTLRLGQYLTPFGIWNVDHGSPVVIPVQRPFVTMLSFPERQTGLELLGRWQTPGGSELGYHFTLSNGTGPISEYGDLDENKAVGGRLWWGRRARGELRVGLSGYYGLSTDSIYEPASNGLFPAAVERISSQFHLGSWAGDLVWKFRGWHLQTELLGSRRKYTDKGRPMAPPGGAMSPPPMDDSWDYGGYFLGGYRFHWLGTMPFVLTEYNQSPGPAGELGVVTIEGGLNLRPLDELAIKASYLNATTVRGTGPGTFRVLQAQVALAF
ncbi:MAG: hypothetical protein QM778_17960 [Myxococcales bacterium]